MVRWTMKKGMAFAAGILCALSMFSLVGCGTGDSSQSQAEKPYAGAPKIVLHGRDYFATDLVIVEELPEGYSYAGELTEEEKEFAYLIGSAYYTREGADVIDEFYVYQECGTPIGEDEVDNTQRQWAYVKWSQKQE